jgi:hypothetical protein
MLTHWKYLPHKIVHKRSYFAGRYVKNNKYTISWTFNILKFVITTTCFDLIRPLSSGIIVMFYTLKSKEQIESTSEA